MAKITITVSGVCGSGKTTLARAFELFLLERGFTNVTMNDVDRFIGCDHTSLQDLRMKGIRDSEVEIITEQVPRIRE